MPSTRASSSPKVTGLGVGVGELGVGQLGEQDAPPVGLEGLQAQVGDEQLLDLGPQHPAQAGRHPGQLLRPAGRDGRPPQKVLDQADQASGRRRRQRPTGRLDVADEADHMPHPLAVAVQAEALPVAVQHVR